MLSACLVIGLTGLNAQQRSVAGLNTVYLDRVVPLRDLKLIADLYAVKIVDATHKTRSGMLSYQQARDDVRTARAEIRRLWGEYMNTSLIDAERQASARIEVLMQKADAPLDDLERILDRHSEKRLAAFVINDLYPLIDPISEGFSELIGLQLGEAKGEYERALALYQRNRVLNIGLLLVMLIGGGIFAMVLLRSISRPLEALKQAAASVAAGDLSRTIECRGRDEITEVQQSIRQMQQTCATPCRTSRARPRNWRPPPKSCMRSPSTPAGHPPAERGKCRWPPLRSPRCRRRWTRWPATPTAPPMPRVMPRRSPMRAAGRSRRRARPFTSSAIGCRKASAP